MTSAGVRPGPDADARARREALTVFLDNVSNDRGPRYEDLDDHWDSLMEGVSCAT